MRNSRIFNGIHRLPRLPGMGLARRSPLTPSKGQKENLPDEDIFSKLPLNISTVNCDGTVCCKADGERSYFSNIDGQDFQKWVGNSVHVQDRVGVLHALDVCRSNHKSTTQEFRTLPQGLEDGTPDWVELKCIPAEKSNSAILIMRDISAQKEVEYKLQKAVEEADITSTAKTRFLANMSHELRTPLNAIIGFSELLKSGMIPENNHEKKNEYHGLIFDSAHHLLKVLNDILDMSKIEAGKYEIYPEEVDCRESLSACCKMLQPIADKAKVDLKFSFDGENSNLEADSRALHQIIINLVSNAIKFSNEGGTVELLGKRVGRTIELSVKDEGCGMEEDQLDALGQPFYQVENSNSRNHEGTGLGLSIVNGLIELHQGKITFESRPDQGTKVTIVLPVHQSGLAPIPGDETEAVIRISPREGEQDLVQLGRMMGAGSNG